jgi:hypothetical protein
LKVTEVYERLKQAFGGSTAKNAVPTAGDALRIIANLTTKLLCHLREQHLSRYSGESERINLQHHVGKKYSTPGN